MKVGSRIYYNQKGQIIYITGECQGDVIPHLENEIISYIDLPFGDKTIETAAEWHIDVENKKIVVDKIREKVETLVEKLQREKQELENQLIIHTYNAIDGCNKMFNDVTVKVIAKRIFNGEENPINKKPFLLEDITDVEYRKAVADYLNNHQEELFREERLH